MKSTGRIFVVAALVSLAFAQIAAAPAGAAGSTPRQNRNGYLPRSAVSTTSPYFAPFQNYNVGSWPSSVAIADVTGDGRKDVLLTTASYFDPDNDFKLFVFRQQADGWLASPTKVSTDGQYADQMGVAADDLNGDGKADVAVATGSGVDLYYQSSGALTGPTLISATGARHLEIADMDGDGKRDMVVATSESVLLLHNTGSSFTQSTISSTGQWEVEVADVSGDGRPDVVGCDGSNECSGAVLNVFVQQAGGGFTWATYTATTDYWPNVCGIGVGDVTGDGKRDVLATVCGNTPGSLINVFRQNASGTLDAPVVYASFDIPEPVEVADVDGDGRQDAVTLHGGWEAAGVYLQQGAGTLGAESLYDIPYASHYEPKGLALGDINSDGRTDIAMADYNYGLVVLRQALPPSALTLSASPRLVSPGQTVSLSGSLSFSDGGSSSGKAIHLSRKNPDASTTALSNVTTGTTGAFSASNAPPSPGSYTYTATFDGDSGHAGSTASENVNAKTTSGRLTADFNGDGFADIALGAPGEDIGGMVNTGSVNVIYGSSTGPTSTGNQLWYEGAAGILGTTQPGDLYGYSAVAGDFNADGFSDLAVGIPGKAVNGATVTGAVNVIYGSANGLTSAGNQVWQQGENGMLDTPEQNDQFGNSLASGDLNGDGFADLVVGAAGENLHFEPNAGAFSVILGSPSGLTSAGNQFWSRDNFGQPAGANDYFGAALSIGDFNGDGFGDVAAGDPFLDISIYTDFGDVAVAYGSPTGLTIDTQLLGPKDTPDDFVESGDAFGFSLAAGDINGDGFADLAIGAPGDLISDSFADHPLAGSVNVVYGSASGLNSDGRQVWHQNSPGIPGRSENNDQFGSSVAVGDFNGDGKGDLAVGAVLEDIGTIVNAGLVDVMYGSTGGLTSAGSQQWYQGYSGIVGSAEKGDYFANTLLVEDFGKGAQEDLVASAVGEDLGRKANAGVAQVIYGGSMGLRSSGNQMWSQDSAGILGAAENGDGFGFGLADGETLSPIHRQ